MKAAVLYDKLNVVVEERPAPGLPAPDEVQVRVRRVGLCGSDLKYYFAGGVSGAIRQPFVLGHEVAGEVAAVGAAVEGLAPGDWVTVEPGKPCWTCSHCRAGDYNLCPNMVFMASRSQDGALREVFNWPANLVYRLPEGVSLLQGSLVEPLSVAYSSVLHAQVRLGSRVLVLGAGPIGLATLQFARLAGAQHVAVSDTQVIRLERAATLGADQPINVSELQNGGLPLDTLSMDVVIDTTGVPAAIEQAYPVIKPGGRLVLVGLDHGHLPLSLIQIVYRQLSIQGVYRFRNTFPAVLHYLATEQVRVEPIVTHRYPLARVEEALRTAARRAEAVKVVIEV